MQKRKQALLVALMAIAGTLIAALMVGKPAPSEASGGNARLDPFTSSAELYPTAAPTVETCVGSDGLTYTLTSIKAVGQIVSSDPRMSGTFYADAKLLHRPDGSGISMDEFEIRDNDTGKVKAKGVARAVDAPFAANAPIKGFVVAKLKDGSRLWAHTTVVLPAAADQPLVVTYGSASPNVQDRAMIMTGHGGCFADLDMHGE